MKKILTFFLLAGSLFAQFNDFEFESFTTADGLSSNWQVKSLVQDKYGYLWIATIDGANKYDGYTFKKYQHIPADSSSLMSNKVNFIFIDSRSRLWISTSVTGGCLSLYDQGDDNFTHFTFVDSGGVRLPMDRIISYYEDENDSLWLVKTNGYYSYESNRWIYNPEKSRPLKSIFTSGIYIYFLYEDSKGIIWIARPGTGLSRYNPTTGNIKNFEYIKGNSNSLKSNIVYSIYEDSSGVTFIGSGDTGLHRYDPIQDKIIRLPEKSGKYRNLSPPISKGSMYGSPDAVSIIKRTDDGNFWLGTVNGGLKVYNRNLDEFKFYIRDAGNKLSLGSELLMDFYSDHQNNHWIGTFEQGFMKVVPSRSMFTLEGNGLSALAKLKINQVRSIFESSDKKLWIGTADGRLVIYNPQTKSTKTYQHNPDNLKTRKGPGGSDIQSFYEDRDGLIWMATFNGIDIYNPKTGLFSKLKINMDGRISELHMDVEGIIADNDGEHIWIATWDKGLLKHNKNTLETEQFRSTTGPNTLAGTNSWTIGKLKDGRICIGTENGLSVYNSLEGSFQNYLAGMAVNTIFENDKQTLWLGTNRGLFSLNLENGFTESFTEENGLHNKMIGGILEYNNFLWIGTGNGLVRFNPEDKTFLTFDASDGIYMNLYETGFSYLRTSDDLLLFGSSSGITVVDPTKITYNNIPPRTLITELKIYDTKSDSVITKYNRIHNHKNKIILEHTENDITFNYVGIHLKKPKRNTYKYKLEPYEQNWKEAGNIRTAHYTSLIPGSYTFKVISANCDGVWNEAATSMELVILPPWWKTLWAYSLYLIFSFTLLFSLRKFELKRRLLQAENKRKTRELEEARQLQFSMLPKELPQIPYLDVAVYMQTATEVGGDYYDFNVSMDGTLTVVIGDATGHGMKAGTMVTTTKSLFNTHAGNPDILFSFNEFSRCIRKMNFGRVSMCLTMLKISDHTMKIATAGMPPSYIYRSASKEVEEFQFEAMPLGAVKEFPYQIKVTKLDAGDTILLLSDGLPELENKTGEMFGYNRIVDGFQSIAEKSPDDIISYLKNEGATWTDNGDPGDDVTFVVIKVK